MRTLSRNQFWRLAAAGLLALLTAAITYVCLETVHGQNADSLTRFALARSKHLVLGIDAYALNSISRSALIALSGLVLLVAVFRRRWQLGVRILVLVVGANLSTQILKHWILTRPSLGVDYPGLLNSLPSGHTTVAMSAALGIIIVAPLKMRSAATLLGWVTTAFVGISVMINQWHRLSDVLTAIFIAGIWGLLLAPREAAPRRFGYAHRITLVVSAIATALGIILTAIVWFQIPAQSLPGYALQSLSARGVGTAAGVTAVAMTFGCTGLILALINTQARSRG